MYGYYENDRLKRQLFLFDVVFDQMGKGIKYGDSNRYGWNNYDYQKMENKNNKALELQKTNGTHKDTGDSNYSRTIMGSDRSKLRSQAGKSGRFSSKRSINIRKRDKSSQNFKVLSVANTRNSQSRTPYHDEKQSIGRSSTRKLSKSNSVSPSKRSKHKSHHSNNTMTKFGTSH